MLYSYYQNCKSGWRLALTALLLVMAVGSASATKTTTIDWSSVTSLPYTDEANGVTIWVNGTASITDGTLTLGANSQLYVTSDNYAIESVSFGTFSDASKMSKTTFNGTFADGTWTPNSGWTNEHTCVIGANAEVTISGTLTLKTADETSAAKTDAHMAIGSYETELQPGYTKFAEPSVVIWTIDQSQNITKYYTLTYYILGQQDAETTLDSDGREVTTDPTTGSYVEKLYGQFIAGTTPGTVSVLVVATPKANYVNTFECASGIYTVNINQINPTLVWSSNDTVTVNVLSQVGGVYDQTMYNTTDTVKLPEYNLVYRVTNGAQVNITDYFDVDTTWIDDNVIVAHKEEGDSVYVYSTCGTTGDVKTGTAKVVYKFTPKSDYKGTYSAVEDTVVINVVQLTGRQDAKLTVVEDTITLVRTGSLSNSNQNGEHTRETGFFTQYVTSNGNDVTGSFEYKYRIVYDSAYYDDCTTTIKQAGESTETTVYTNKYIQTSWAGFVKVVVEATANYWQAASVLYNAIDTLEDAWGNKYPVYGRDTICINIIKRVPTIVIDPDPATVPLSVGDSISYSTKFNIYGIYEENYDYDVAGDTLSFGGQWGGGETFWYTFNIEAKTLQDSILVVQNWPSDMPIDTIRNAAGEDSVYYFHSDAGYGEAYSSWSIKFNKAGVYPITYTIHAWNHNHWDIGSDGLGSTTYEFVVDTIIRPTLVIDPDYIRAYRCDGKKFTEPSVRVIDHNGKDITDYYKIRYALDGVTPEDSVYTDEATGTKILAYKNESRTGDDYFVSTDTAGTVYIGCTSTGDVIVTVYADSLQENYASLNGTYTIHIVENQGEPTVDVITPCEYTLEGDATKNYGMLHFISTGKIYGGTTYTGVPGLDFTVGVQQTDDADDVFSVVESETEDGWVSGAKKCYVTGDAVELDEDGIPTGGLFYKLNPYVNGYFIIDALWEKGHKYVIVDENGNEQNSKSFDTNTYEDVTCTYPLVAGKTYYLYDLTGGDLELHSVGYIPAFVQSAKDTEATETCVIFMNGYSGNVPTLLTTSSEYVTFTSSNTNYVTVDETGTLTPVAQTINLSDDEKYVTITAAITSDSTENCATLVKTVSFKVMVSDIPTYIVSGSDWAQGTGDMVSTTNIPTAITMKFGGWKLGGNYTRGTKTYNDTWSYKGTGDRIGGGADDTQEAEFNQYLDGFTSFVAANNNAYDEDNNGYATYEFDSTKVYYETYEGVSRSKDGTNTISAQVKSSYTLPCKGAYMQFEPRENGLLIVYLVQNGACDKHPTNEASSYYKMAWRPLYIVDERGKPVTMDNNFTTVNEYLPSGSTQADNLGSYTKGVFRATVDDADVAAVTATEGKYAIDGMKYADDCAYSWEVFNGTAQDADSLIKVWKGKAVGDRQDIIRLENGGFHLVSKAAVRYAFQVKAGKTYFIFQHGSKPEFGGFSFVPENYPNQASNEHETVSLSATAQDSETEYEVKSNVKAAFGTPRTISADNWATFCLPFAVSESRFAELFGEKATVLTADSVLPGQGDDLDTLHFTQHAYRMMEAGRPYIVSPTKDVNLSEIDSVSFEGIAHKTFDHKINDSYTFMGVYDQKETMPTYSYFFKSTAMSRYTGTKGKSLGIFRCYFKYSEGSTSGSNKARRFAVARGTNALTRENISIGDGATTGILLVITDDDGNVSISEAPKDGRVYNVNGQVVSESADDLNSLPHGIYIVNGKKYVVE